jgi:hypothetical protein
MEAFLFYSGNQDPGGGNFPAMFAYGTGENEVIAVLGIGSFQTFPMSKSKEAFAAYHELLKERGYHPQD